MALRTKKPCDEKQQTTTPTSTALPFSLDTLDAFGCQLPFEHPLLRDAWKRRGDDTSGMGAHQHHGGVHQKGTVSLLLPALPGYDVPPQPSLGHTVGNSSSTLDTKVATFLDYFHPVGCLGRGSFGEVLLVQYRPAPKWFFAAKSVGSSRSSSSDGGDDGHANAMAEWAIAVAVFQESLKQEKGAAPTPRDDTQLDACHGNRNVLRYLCSVQHSQPQAATQQGTQRRGPTAAATTSVFLVTELAPLGTLSDANDVLFSSHVFADSYRDDSQRGRVRCPPPPSIGPLQSLPPPPDKPWRMVRLLCQALAGLAYLHRRQILHRDIKPANLLLCYDVAPLKQPPAPRAANARPQKGDSGCDDAGFGDDDDDDDDDEDDGWGDLSRTERLVIGDFGISKHLGSATTMKPMRLEGAPEDLTLSTTEQHHHQHLNHPSDMHTVIGTLAYAAPEVLGHWGTSPVAPYHAPADVYSLGAVFYCWLARDDVTQGIMRGPQDVMMLLEGELPKLMDLLAFADTKEGDDCDHHHAHDNGGRPRTLFGHHFSSSVTTVSLSASMVQKKQEASWRREGRRLLPYPEAMLRCVDAMLHVDPSKRPTAAEALVHLRRGLECSLRDEMQDGRRPVLPPHVAWHDSLPRLLGVTPPAIMRLLLAAPVNISRVWASRWVPLTRDGAEAGGGAGVDALTGWCASVVCRVDSPATHDDDGIPTVLWFWNRTQKQQQQLVSSQHGKCLPTTWLACVRHAAELSGRAVDVISGSTKNRTEVDATRTEVVLVHSVPPLSRGAALSLVSQSAAIRRQWGASG